MKNPGNTVPTERTSQMPFPKSWPGHIKSAALNVISLAHVFGSGYYEPNAQGPLLNINYHSQLISPKGRSVAYRLLLVQGDNYYVGPSEIVTSTVSTTYEHNGLTEDEFAKVRGTGPDKPNFSVTGLRIQFGYVSADSNTFSATTSTESGIDNCQ